MFFQSDYLTDVVGRKAEGFLNSWSKGEKIKEKKIFFVVHTK